jgi:hypothetical protein
MHVRTDTGLPPSEITTLLRVEGLVLLAASLTAFQLMGGNWWLFAALILAPDIAMLGALGGPAIGARLYNLAHTTTVPAITGAVAWLAGLPWLLPVVVIWLAHIGMDRAFGYGLKYPGLFHATHLGRIGRAKRESTAIADAG